MLLQSNENYKFVRALYLITFMCLCFILNVKVIRAEDTLPKPVFNVFDFGAKGDGVTDDTDAIQQAINACINRSGTVLLHNGTFLSGMLKLGS